MLALYSNAVLEMLKIPRSGAVRELLYTVSSYLAMIPFGTAGGIHEMVIDVGLFSVAVRFLGSSGAARKNAIV